MKPTIKDIAAQAGVSIATVSRVLSNKRGTYSEKTKEKILKVAKELGYHKNTTAVDLVKKKADEIAVIINATPTNFSNMILSGIQQRATELGQRVIILYAGDRNTDMQHQAITTVMARSVSGILLLAVEPDATDLELLKETRTPFCFVSLYFGDDQILSISSDNKALAYQATEYLINNGHTKIGLAGIDDYHTGSQRVLGYQTAMRDHGLVAKNDWVKRGDYSYEAGRQLLQAFLPLEVTAIIAASDMVAVGLLNAAQQSQIAVPDKLSIIGIDGTFICEVTTPPITSVTQNFYEIGVRSVDKVMGKATETFVPTRIVVRGSVKLNR
ncbi:LacI family DNA-binding transcriptional regulator [Lentilactobacillus kisonensis]|uniref:Transcriptional regulator, LacI family n=2 Tax=Lentilactobacillus kisonensis TaxID=481722 RepID=H1LFU2_9LACO|nr:LacI family DNA-binding transcriptional regulator [Lentilactobacillus kisonensis]EHO51534.1 transcriptional regulator, LacI family [Lentilactobacillus kisonensis F0435]KRL22900.1 transcriptional regulator, LacI family [Lentilactobacillus kisonensis DSM 19906 = JCM 15041]